MWLLNMEYFPWVALVLGLILGSFYNVCVFRYLAEESIVSPGSHCPKCGHVLSWWENIPLLSYLLLLGRCRKCKVHISLQYPIVELLSGLWALGLAFKFGPSMVWVLFMVIGGILIVASFIDFEAYILPDILTLPGAVIALAGAYFILRPALGVPTLEQSVIGALSGAGVFLLLQRLFRKLKGREGLGTGDIKLMLMIGALAGWMALPIIIIISAVSALVASLFYMFRSKGQALQTMVPFGPFLSLGLMLYILFGHLYWQLLLAQ